MHKPQRFRPLNEGQDLYFLHQNGPRVRLDHVVQYRSVFKDLGLGRPRFSQKSVAVMA